jgi:hypothetical protein
MALKTPKQFEWWSTVRAGGRRRFIWRIALLRYGMRLWALQLLLFAAIHGVTTAVRRRPWESWSESVATVAICQALATFLVLLSWARTYWAAAEREWLAHQEETRAS